MRLWPRHRTSVFALLTCSAACSLRSLDYLERGEASTGTAATAGTAAMNSGGNSGASHAGSGGSGVAGKSGAGGSEGGSGNTASSGGSGTAGTGGGASGVNGAGASGGSVDPAGGASGSGGASGVGGGDVGGAGSDDGGAAGEGGVPGCMPGEAGCPPAVEETSYVLRPGHAPGKCADMYNFAVGEGAMAIQYNCHQQINQVFWAQEHADGYISLRNAFSAQCLEVTGASLVENAPIEQWPCTGDSSQLFLPVPAADGMFKLVLQHSELLLDVSGAASSSNATPLVQNADDGRLDMTWQLERSDVGAFVTLAAEDARELLLRHDGSELLMEESAEASAEWKVVPGLANPACVSFASRDDSNRYLRQKSFAVFREQNDGGNSFALDATYCFRAPLTGSHVTSHALESEGYPGYYLVRASGGVHLQELEDSAEFRTAATWRFGQLWP